MKFDSRYHHRESTRLRGYDYSRNGAYFLTVCTFERECLFGEVLEGEMVLSDFGRIVEEEWLRSIEMRAALEADVFVVMPNHLHGIVLIHAPPTVGASGVLGKTAPRGACPPARPFTLSAPTSPKNPLVHSSAHSKPPSPSASTPLERPPTSPSGSAITTTKSSEARPSSSRPRFTWTVTLERGPRMKKILRFQRAKLQFQL